MANVGNLWIFCKESLLLCIYIYTKNTLYSKTMQLTNRKFYPWLVVGLLWVVALLNYLDRQMLSTMQSNIALDIPALRNAEMFGWLMAVFLWVYGIASPLLRSRCRPREPQMADRGVARRMVGRHSGHGLLLGFF